MKLARFTKTPVSKILRSLIFGIGLRIAYRKTKLAEIESWGDSTFDQYKQGFFRSLRQQRQDIARCKNFERRSALIPDAVRRTDGESYTFVGIPSRCPYCDTPRMRGDTPLIIGRYGGWNDRNGKDIGLIWWHSHCTRCRNEIDHSYATIEDPYKDFVAFQRGRGDDWLEKTIQKPTSIVEHWLESHGGEKTPGSIFIAYHIEWIDSMSGETVHSRQQCNPPFIGMKIPRTRFWPVKRHYHDKAICLRCGKPCSEHPLAEDFLRYESDGTPAFHRLCDGTLVQLE